MVQPRGVVIRNRPKRYKAKDAAYAVGGNRGLYIAMPPSKYPLTAQQRKIKEVASKCGIKSGMSKAELQKQMKECVGPAMRK